MWTSGGKRAFDVVFSVFLLAVLAPLFLLISILVKMTSQGPVLHWSSRVGKDNELFSMPKFRSMRTNTPQVATHLLEDPAAYLTPIGGMLRRTSLDEIPQLISILKGDLTFVGSRPALFNQSDLVRLRTESGIHRLVPGMTGWAQVNGRDELPIPVKVQFDGEYLRRQSLGFDLHILALTLLRVTRQEGIKH